MYGFPGQNTLQIKKDIKEIVRLKSEHVSLYTLTLEPNSKFFLDCDSKAWPREQRLAAFYELVRTHMEEAGYVHYEISNFAKLRYASRHNCLYWQGEDYIGLGVAAHSHFRGHRFWNVSRLPRYFDLMKTKFSAKEGEEFLCSAERLRESLVFGLRMNRGVDVLALQKKHGVSFSDEQKNQIVYLMKSKFLILSRGRLQVTNQGRLILDEISARLM
jgi:oxygen-independent coproporphyrinogen III oxidase